MASAADQLTGGGRLLLDLTALPLANLLGLAGRDSPLAQQLRLQLTADHDQTLSAFSSFADARFASQNKAGGTG